MSRFQERNSVIDSGTMFPAPSERPAIAAVALLAEPVRRRVYEWVVGQHRQVGRAETAKALGITHPLATFHLDRLAEGGLLDAAYRRINQRRGPGAGRPARVYWRADENLSVSLPERRYELAARTFAEALESTPRAAGAAEAAARAAGRHLVEALPDADRRRAAAVRLRTALETNGYEPIIERPAGTIRLRNCPFDALVVEHRELVCGVNLAMAEGLVEAIGPKLRYRPVPDPRPGFCCVAFEPVIGPG
jgi:predicted ArsR family transcriptional regulator